jgi:uncharacterized membrane protein
MEDKLKILMNPNYKPSCSINPIISCGSVMQSTQAHAFGFPNPFLGLISFPAIITFGALLIGGAKVKRWVWLVLQAGTLLAVLFVHWLFFESVFRIHALCPYCMGVWIVSIALFWYVLLYNLREKNIKTPAKLKGLVNFVQKHHLDVLIAWYLIIIIFILHHFWYYWKTLI